MVDKQTMQNITEASAAKWRRLNELEAEVERLREALKPFALSADDADKDDMKDGETWMVLAGWLREARAALQEPSHDG